MFVDLNKMQKRINKLTEVFTNLTSELDSCISQLKRGVDYNDETIASLERTNILYNDKIGEYEKLKYNIENIIG